MGAFKIGIIILFLQIMRLRHRFMNLPEHTQQIIGRTGIQKRSIWSWSVCYLIAKYIVWSVQLLTPFFAMLPCRWSVLSTPFTLGLALCLSLASGIWGAPCLCNSFKDALSLMCSFSLPWENMKHTMWHVSNRRCSFTLGPQIRNYMEQNWHIELTHNLQAALW